MPPSPVAPSVTEVTAVVKSGLSLKGDGGYVEVVGEEIILDTVLNDKAPDIVEYKWFISSGGQKSLIGEGKTLEYTFVALTKDTYEFYVTANGVESSNKILTFVKQCIET